MHAILYGGLYIDDDIDNSKLICVYHLQKPSGHHPSLGVCVHSAADARLPPPSCGS